eukprot:COSAG01_NODE_2856_length_6964_cov_15.382957_9_plen_40_part_00
MFSERKTNRPICCPAGCWLIPEKSAEFSESIWKADFILE